jgi:hypothetical protein
MSDVVVSLGGRELVIERPKLGVILRLSAAWGGDVSKYYAAAVAALAYGWPAGGKDKYAPPCVPVLLRNDVIAISDEALEVLVVQRGFAVREVQEAGAAVFKAWLALVPQEQEIEAAAGNSQAQDPPSAT